MSIRDQPSATDRSRRRVRQWLVPVVATLAACALATGVLVGVQDSRADRVIPVSRAVAVAGARVDPVAIDRFMVDNLRATGLPGATLALISDRRVVEVAGYGSAADGHPLSGSTPMAIGSVSKAMTATAVMQLVESHRVDLDQPVRSYLPEFRTATGHPDRITVRQLLNQTSGLADSGFAEMSLPQPRSLANEIERLHQAKPIADPGVEWNYHNPNYHVLARLVEVVSGEPFGDYLSRHVFGPAGMANTRSVTTPADPDSRLDRGAVDAAGVPVFVPALDHFVAGSGGVVSTATDLASWVRVQLDGGRGVNGRVVGPDTVRQMQSAQVKDPDYGFGWFVSDDGPLGHTVDHGGTLFTYSSDVALFPDRGDGFAVLFNDVTPNGAEQASFSAGLTALLAGDRPVLGAPVAQTLGRVVVPLTCIATALGIIGVRHARRWAWRRQTRGRTGTALRLAWLAAPVGFVLLTPALVGALFGGRDVTWPTAWYGWAALVVLLATVAASCLATGLARIVSLARTAAAGRRGTHSAHQVATISASSRRRPV